MSSISTMLADLGRKTLAASPASKSATATKLRNVKVREVSAVDTPANQFCNIVFHKNLAAPAAQGVTFNERVVQVRKLLAELTALMSGASAAAPTAGVAALEKALHRRAGTVPTSPADVAKTGAPAGLERALARLSPHVRRGT